MSFLFILAVIFVIVFVVAFITWLIVRRDNVDDLISGWVALAAGVIAVILVLLSSTAIVGTKQVGVVTTFNRPTDSVLANGLNFKSPWQQVTQMDATIQTDNYVNEGDGGQCIEIRIGNGSVACIDATIRWRIIPETAPVLFVDYRNTATDGDINDAIKESLVKRELTSALNEVYGSYDPLAAVKGGENVQVDSLSNAVQEAMIDRVTSLGEGSAQVEVLSVTTPLIHLDEDTQGKIDAFQQEVANTRIAEQREATAAAQAAANKALADSVSNDPNVLVSACLDMVAKGGVTLPAGFSCWPGGSSAVVAPSAPADTQ